MNQRRSTKDWDRIAREYGCESMQALLYKYYVERRMTTRAIAAEVLDVGKDRVAQLLKAHGIPLRSRGGI